MNNNFDQYAEYVKNIEFNQYDEEEQEMLWQLESYNQSICEID